jgi:hypothetical protein
VPLACPLVALLLAAQPAAGGDPAAPVWELELAVPVAVLGGHTTYRIEGADATSSVASELAFDLGGFLGGVEARVAAPGTSEGSRLVFRLGVLHSLGGSTGTLEDSDWLDGAVEATEVGAAHPGLDIYSESDAELDALVVDARIGWEGWRAAGVLVSPVAGLLVQRFEYEVRDLHQVGYGPYAPLYTGAVPGSVLDYRVTYTVPYVGVRAARAAGPLSGWVELWGSPAADASDRDDHLLRGKLSTSEASGTAWQGSAAVRVALGARDFLEAQGSITRVSATGTQHQRFYAGPNAGLAISIDSEITSSRASFFMVYAHRL